MSVLIPVRSGRSLALTLALVLAPLLGACGTTTTPDPTDINVGDIAVDVPDGLSLDSLDIDIQIDSLTGPDGTDASTGTDVGPSTDGAVDPDAGTDASADTDAVATDVASDPDGGDSTAQTDATADTDTVSGTDTISGSDTAVVCNDNNACTSDSVGGDGQCVFAPISADDNNLCTTDACDPAAGVTHTDVVIDDGDPCTVDACDPATGVTHTAVDTDDGNACTVDACDPATGVTHTDVAIDDGNACTVDACDPATGVTHTAVDADDGDACTIDACDPAFGVTYTDVAIDDGNACTTDSCDPVSGVSHVQVNADDDNACTVDACDSAAGVTHTTLDPDDNNACTIDSCDPDKGITHVQVVFDDNNACTTDACDPTTGISHSKVATDDNNACTTDSCDPTTGVSHVPNSPDDNNACTTDACDPATGVTHTDVALDDNNACTADACDPATGVTHTVIDPDDDNVCTIDSCDPATGVTHTDVAMDDNNACTLDTCDPVAGVAHTEIDPSDFDVCTLDACDPATGVTHTDIALDDGNACTVDLCDPVDGPSHATLVVDDNNACTQDFCDPVDGPYYQTVTVDDGSVCTADSCDPAQGVLHTPIDLSDDNACTEDLCDPVSGAYHEPVDPADQLGCTLDTCDPATGVNHASRNWLCPASQVCDAGQGCVAAGGANPQKGPLVITELEILGKSARLEVFNSFSAPINLTNGYLVNDKGEFARIRLPGDTTEVAQQEALLGPGDYAMIGGEYDEGVDFVILSEQPWDLSDDGGAVAILSKDGDLIDYVRHHNQHSGDASEAVGPLQFPVWTGATSSLAPQALSVTGNDDVTNWCTTFWPTPGQPKKRVYDTWSQANGSCSDLVINEVLYNPAGNDDGLGFVEIAGPGGAYLTGVSLHDIEGKGGSAGGPNSVADAKLPADWRVPVDGILLIADGTGNSTSDTGVTAITPADVIVPNLDLENADGDALLLTRALVLMDVVAVESTGADLAASTVSSGVAKGLVMKEGATAIPPPASTASVMMTLARRMEAPDTNVNADDFQADPSPTPGEANDGVFPQIQQVAPNNASTTSAAGNPVVTVTGQDLGIGSKLRVGLVETAPCTATSSSQMTCTVAKGGTTGHFDVSLLPVLSMREPEVTVANAFTWHTHVNETGLAEETDQCTLLLASTTTTSGLLTAQITLQVAEAGITDAQLDQSKFVRVELGMGTSATDPRSHNSWRWQLLSFVGNTGEFDDYAGQLLPPETSSTITQAYTGRVSLDGGLSWTYCDTDGAGSADTFDFSTAKLGLLTVNP